MDGSGLTPEPSVSPRVDAACDRFEARLRRGESPDPSDHLGEVPEEERAELGAELAFIEAAWRERRSGPPAAEDGRFQLLERLGAGSFGATWRARDARLGRDVALKLAHPLLGEEAERFAREARAASRLRHEGIARVHEATEVGGRKAIVTELVPGQSLAQRLESGPRPGAREAAEIVAAIADALQHAHEQGVVHRDVKPQNVMLDERSGRPVLVDFGLARDASADSLTLDGHVLGTPAYMSPEQARGDGRTADERTDVHACGAVLYEMLTGRPPFPAGPGLLDRIVRDEPVPPRRLEPGLARDIETITLKALAKSPAARYPSAAALASDLRAWLGGRPIAARPVSRVERAARWARREPVLAVGGAVIAVLLGAVAVVSLRSARSVARERDAVLQALSRVSAAEAERDEQAFESRVSEAEALVSSSLPGRRFGALDAIDEAQRMLGRLPGRAARELRLRSLLAAALCAHDLRPGPRWALPPGTTAVGFGADGRLFARSDELGTISVRDESDEEIASLPGPGAPATRLSFSPDGRAILAEHESKGAPMLAAWEIEGARRIAVLQPAPPAAAWAADSRGAHVALPGGETGVLDLATGIVEPRPFQRGVPIHASSDGRLVLRDAHDLRRLSVVRAEDGRELARVLVAEDAWVAVLSPDRPDRMLVSQGNDMLALELPSGRTLAVLRGHQSPVIDACFAPGGRSAASHAWDGVTRQWDTESGGALAAVINSAAGPPLLTFTADGSRILGHSDGMRAGLIDCSRDVPVSETDLGAMLGRPPGIADISADGRLLAAWAEPGRVGRPATLVDLRSRRVVASLPGRDTFTATFVRSRTEIVTSGGDGVVAWPLREEDGEWSVGPARVLLDESCRDAAVSADGTVVAAVSSGSREVVIVDALNASVLRRILSRRLPFSLGLDETGRRVAMGSWHLRLGACHDTADGRLLHEPSSRSSLSVTFSPADGSLIVDGGSELRLLDPDTGATRAALPLGGGSDVPLRPAVARHAGLIAVADRRVQGALRLLDARTLRDVLALSRPGLASEAIAWCALDDSARILCAGTVSGRMITWDLQALRAGLRERGLDWAPMAGSAP